EAFCNESLFRAVDRGEPTGQGLGDRKIGDALGRSEKNLRSRPLSSTGLARDDRGELLNLLCGKIHAIDDVHETSITQAFAHECVHMAIPCLQSTRKSKAITWPSSTPTSP